MISLYSLRDDELLLVLPKLRLGELLKLKNTCKRFNNLVATHFKLQKVLDYSLPVPLEEARKANDERETGNLIRATAGTTVIELRFSQPEPLADYLKMTRSLILSTAGPNLTDLGFSEPRGEERLYLEDDFVAALANKCPKIKFLKTKNYPALLKYCEINGDSVEELELSARHMTSTTVLVAILKLSPNVKRLRIVAAKGRSISWVSDVLKSNDYSLESVTISYHELTSQLFDEIQLIVKLSGNLAQVNLEISGRSVTESHEVALHAQLYNQLPQLASTRFRTQIKDIEALGPYIASLTVVIIQPDFSFEFLKSYKKLLSLWIGGHQQVMTLEPLVETLPDSVRIFGTASGNDIQFERLTNLLQHRGAQLEQLEVRLLPSSSNSDAKQFLLEVGVNCSNIRVLKFENDKVDNAFDLTLDCTEQFEAMVSKVKSFEHIEMKGIFVRQEAVAKAIAECKHLVHIDVQILETTFDPVELYNMLYKSSKLYRAKLTSVRMDGTLSNKGVYHYVNGMHYNELPTLNENPLLPLDV